MGHQKVETIVGDNKKAKFIRHMLDDIRALELMIEKGLIEDDIIRIGAEQECCLVSDEWRPSPVNMKVLNAIEDKRFTTELANYNIEINLDPLELKGNCFAEMESQLRSLLSLAKEESNKHDSKVFLTGILPTIRKKHVSLDYITPNPRYYNLNEMLMKLRRDHFYLHLQGVDELSITHDSVLFEACNTSFQTHLQIKPSDFVSSFNWSQAITGPILSICTNSPLLLGRELWRETRIALFRQSIDTRSLSLALKDEYPRVFFGNDWVEGSVVNIYKDNIANYKVILGTELPENSLEVLKEGGIPKLKAMNLHSGTIYPWNRACYGVGNGKPHLRIENRYLPSGPSVLDEMANFALWVGIMLGRPKKYDDMASIMDFKEAKSNFIKAARYGKDALLHWDGELRTVKELMVEVFLPMAYRGLAKAGVDGKDIERLLTVIQGRLDGNCGSEWMVKNYRKLRKHMNNDKALRILNRYTYINQNMGIPVHHWEDVDVDYQLIKESKRLGHIMSTHLFTVRYDDLAILALKLIEWKQIHHVPVVDDSNNMVGLLTWTHLQKYSAIEQGDSLYVEDIMVKDVISANPDTTIVNAIKTMKDAEIGCLPILDCRELVGIVTIHDLRPYDQN